MNLKYIRDRIQEELDLQDEKFITPDEVNSAINQAIRFAGSKIYGIHEHYFNDFEYLPLEKGVSIYNLPSKMFANKIVRVIYTNNGDHYVVKRLVDVESSVIAGDYNDYTYMLINDANDGIKIHLYPSGLENSSFTNVVNLAEHIKQKMNDHYMDTVAHGTGADTSNFISLSKPKDKYELFNLINKMTDNYNSHWTDADKSFGWSYHIGQETISSQLPYISSINSLNDAVNRLNDIYDTYTIHIADPDSHGLIDDYPITESKVSNAENNVKVFYLRRPNELIEDTDVLDIPEFVDFIVAKAKNYLLNKDFGNPMKIDVRLEVEEQLDLMLQTLSNRVEDTQSELRIKNDPYNGGIV